MIYLLNRFRFFLVPLVASTVVIGCSESARTSRTFERAERALSAGEYDKAKIDYMSVLRADPRNTKAVQRLGQIWSESGAPIRAIPFLLKVRDLDPADLASRNRLAQALFGFGQLSEARNEAIEVLKREPGDIDALLMMASTTVASAHVAETEQALRDFPAKDTAGYHIAAGNLAARRGDPAAAEAAIRKANSLDEKSALAHLSLGFVLAARGDRVNGIEELRIASELAPTRSNEKIKYAEVLASSGNTEKAEAVARQITEKAPDYFPAWRLLAQIALNANKPDEALARLENVFSRDPQDLEGGILQAQALMAKGDAKQAIERLESANTTFQGNIPLLKFRLAEAYSRDNQTDKAIATLNEVITADPQFVEPQLALAELNLRAGNGPAVVTAMSELTKKRPDLPMPRMLLAAAHQKVGQLDDAAALLQEQIKRYPISPEAHLLLGAVLRQQNKLPEARDALQRAVGLSPGSLQPIAALVDLEIAEKNFAAALERARDLIQKDPKSPVGSFFEARVYHAQQDWAAAEAALQKSIELDPNFGDAYGLLIATYLAADQLPQASGRLEEIVRRNPASTQGLMLLGLVKERLSDFPRAAEAYEKLIAITPDSAAALNNLAYLYAEHLNQPQKAVELGRRARAAQPGDAPITDTLGWALFKAQDYPQALAMFQESAPVLADLPEAQFHLGMASYMMGRRDEAKAAFERALAMGKEFAGKAEAQRRLELLQGGGAGAVESVSREELEKLVAAQPSDVVGWSRLAEVYERETSFKQAAEAYEKARQLNPKLLSANLKLAQLYAGPLNDKPKAIELAKKARELAPTDPEAAAVLGRVAFEAGNFPWAYSLLQESARRRTDDPELMYDLARAAYVIGKIPEARATMERCLEAAADAPHAADAKRFLKFVALEQPSPEVLPAEEEARTVLQTQPQDLSALMVQAAAQLQRGDAKGASASYARVLQTYPDFAPAQKRLAAIYADTSDRQSEAYDLAQKARRALPEDPDLARTLGEINMQRKDFAAAIRLFQQSAAKQPLPAKSLYHLGLAQLETKRESEGRQTIERALAEGLDGPLAEQAKQRLEQALSR